MSFNPWHDASIGENAPDIVESVIEIPKHSKAKYELDKSTGMLRLDRVLFSSMMYPENYGFIPETYGDDKDPLDIIVLSQVKIKPMCLISAKVIGMMEMVDDGENDEKIIAVANDDMGYNNYNSVEELPPHFGNELKNFFEEYKQLENKTVKVGDIKDRNAAIAIIEKATEAYKEKFASK